MSNAYTPTTDSNWTTVPDDVEEALDELADAKVHKVGNDDVEFTLATVGPILRSANGKRWRILVDNDGIYSTTEVT